MRAAAGGHLNIAISLLEAGADASLEDKVSHVNMTMLTNNLMNHSSGFAFCFALLATVMFGRLVQRQWSALVHAFSHGQSAVAARIIRALHTPPPNNTNTATSAGTLHQSFLFSSVTSSP
jgi:hypothetical protein